MTDEVLWEPSPERVRGSAMERLRLAAPGPPEDYHQLWAWSVDDLAGFWRLALDQLGPTCSRPPDRVLADPSMPGARWLEGAELSYADNLLRGDPDRTAVVAADETGDSRSLTLGDLRAQVAAVAGWLADRGVGRGDRVAALLPNRPEALVLLLAANAVGATFSSCSPDFGPTGVTDRFGQIRPRVLAVADGYHYAGKQHPLQDKVDRTVGQLDDLQHLLVVDVAGCGLTAPPGPRATRWAEVVAGPGDADLRSVQLPADHPLYVLYSSGTTGPPKSIVHGQGGVLLKHLVEHKAHTDVRPGDVVFWFTTTGWMMWNWLVSALACEATVVLYDGSPAHPDPGVLWRLAERAGVTHFGTSPRYLAMLAERGVDPAGLADLSRLRTLLSTGSPLAPWQFDWAYDRLGPDLHLASISGGTDLVGCFAAGVPTLPVRRGELQARCLGMAVEAWDERGEPVVGEPGELVCTRPFPSMPLGLWGDEDGQRYRDAYFAEHPGVWTHGDFVEVRPSGGVVILGRSDTTLNPGGIRIGTAELYRAVEPMAEVVDAIAFDRPAGDDVEVVLCVVLADGVQLDDDLADRIRRRIRAETTPRHVPHHLEQVAAVPYTLSGKKVEKACRKAVLGEPIGNRDALANPEALDEYAALDLA